MPSQTKRQATSAPAWSSRPSKPNQTATTALPSPFRLITTFRAVSLHIGPPLHDNPARFPPSPPTARNEPIPHDKPAPPWTSRQPLSAPVFTDLPITTIQSIPFRIARPTPHKTYDAPCLSPVQPRTTCRVASHHPSRQAMSSRTDNPAQVHPRRNDNPPLLGTDLADNPSAFPSCHDVPVPTSPLTKSVNISRRPPPKGPTP